MEANRKLRKLSPYENSFHCFMSPYENMAEKNIHLNAYLAFKCDPQIGIKVLLD